MNSTRKGVAQGLLFRAYGPSWPVSEDTMRLRYALLAATLIAAGASGAALAQRGPVYDPAQLPEVKGKIAQYLLTPRGDVGGLLLTDGTEVHVPPHLSTQLVFTVKPGDTVTIHGLRARATPMVLAASVTNDATNATVLLEPHGRHGGPGQQIEAAGRVKAELHTPRGDVDGVLLESGTIVRLPPPEAQKHAAALAVGQAVFVRGFGYEGPLGSVIAAQALGADKEHTEPVAGPRPPGPGFGPGPGGHGHGHGPWHDGPGGPGPMGGPPVGPMGGPPEPPPE